METRKTIPIEKIFNLIQEEPFSGSEQELNDFISNRGAKSLREAFLLGRKDFASSILLGTGTFIPVNVK